MGGPASTTARTEGGANAPSAGWPQGPHNPVGAPLGTQAGWSHGFHTSAGDLLPPNSHPWYQILLYVNQRDTINRTGERGGGLLLMSDGNGALYQSY